MTSPPPGFSYVASLLTPAEQEELLRQIKRLEFQHDSFRGQRLKRSYAQFGYSYASTGRKLTRAAEMPDFLLAVVDRALPHCPDDADFTQCIVTHYPSRAGIGWHTDAPSFGPYVLGVSLASPARFQLRPQGAEDASFELEAAPGSMYLMQQEARWNYQHQVLAVKSERYSLTFRSVPGDE